MDCNKALPRPFVKSVGYKRTFTGCWNCRSKKKKCDEKKPDCTACEKSGKKCTGYGRNLVWVSNDQKTYRHNSRRFLDPENTWKDSPALSQTQLDDLINACDLELDETELNEESPSPFSVFRRDRDKKYSSEQCNPIETTVPTPIESTGDNPVSDTDCNDDHQRPATQGETRAKWQLTLPKTPRAETRLDPRDAYLFQYYLTHVAPLLTPVHFPQNPWLKYPAVALHRSFNSGQKQLLHALMSMSAIHIGSSGRGPPSMSTLGMSLYSSAMAELRACINKGSVGHIDLLMTMMIFVFIELFEGHSEAWRCHLAAAWKFLKQYRASKLWAGSEDIWYVLQSFFMLKIASETSPSTGNDLSIDNGMSFDSEGDISLESLTCNPVFGWTMGASSSVMECISEINRYHRLQSTSATPVSTVLVSAKLSRMLSEKPDSYPRLWTAPASKDHIKAMRLHLRAFKAATIIYYHQTVHNISPRELKPYTSEVLNSLSAFSDIFGGTYTIWPAFIACVEAYTEKDKDALMILLQSNSHSGKRRRAQLKAIAEGVWDIRATTAAERNQQPEDVIVDWRKVQRGLEIDVLLL